MFLNLLSVRTQHGQLPSPIHVVSIFISFYLKSINIDSFDKIEMLHKSNLPN